MRARGKIWCGWCGNDMPKERQGTCSPDCDWEFRLDKYKRDKASLKWDGPGRRKGVPQARRRKLPALI